jgi:hypothetical protein
MSRESFFPQHAEQAVGFQQRSQTQQTVTSQKLVQPGNLVHSGTHNTFSLVPGNYGDYMGKANASIQGAPGTQFAGGAYKAQVQATTIEHTAAVTIHAGADGQWMNSRFSAVTVEAGAHAVFTNCRFSGILRNDGAPADVRCIGCRFDVSPVNVTVIG